MKLYQKSLRLSKPKYYSSIDYLPVGIFNKILKTGEVERLCYTGKVRTSRLEKAWNDIMIEFVDEFGIIEEYEQYLELMKEVCILYEKVYLEGDRTSRTLARHKEAEAAQILKGIPDVDFGSSLAKVSKKMGFRVDPNKTPVREFYGYLKSDG